MLSIERNDKTLYEKVQKLLKTNRAIVPTLERDDPRKEYFDYSLKKALHEAPREFNMKGWTPVELEQWLLKQTDWKHYESSWGPYYVCNECQLPGVVVVDGNLPENIELTLQLKMIDHGREFYTLTTPLTEEMKKLELRSMRIYYDPNVQFHDGHEYIVRIEADFERGKLGTCTYELSWFMQPENQDKLPVSWNKNITNKHGAKLTILEADRLLFSRAKLI